MRGLNEVQKQEVAEICAQAVMQALQASGIVGKGERTKAPEEPKVEFVKRNGEKKMVSAAQARAWDAAREASDERKATYATRRAAFVAGKVPKALKDAIIKDRASVTVEVARSLGFVGSKKDLKALKAEILK